MLHGLSVTLAMNAIQTHSLPDVKLEIFQNKSQRRFKTNAILLTILSL